jgi:uncharacterized protein
MSLAERRKKQKATLSLDRFIPGKTVKILSVDGGGFRGYLAALIMEDLEKRRLARGIKKPFCKCFDMMAGTSTGSLITLGLATPAFKATGYTEEVTDNPPDNHEVIHRSSPDFLQFWQQLWRTPKRPAAVAQPADRTISRNPRYSAADIAAIYREKGAEIFPQSIFKQLNTVRHAFIEKYDAGNYDQVLLEAFENLTLRDALSTVLVTSYDTITGKPLIMKNLKKEDNFLLREAARGSSAAPTYFEPVMVKGLESGQEYCLVDGGVFANNPAMCAYVEARRLYPLARNFFILSLGTGRQERSLTLKQMKSWGYMEWVMPSKGVPLISMMSSGQNRCVDYQLDHLSGVNYVRINPPLGSCSDVMDDASPKNTACLEELARKTIEENDDLLERIARFL